ncbi:hypothetical protein GCM10009077_40730 [Roseibium denhamense]|uniref:Transposase n=1 Tax=Roseibium denhamense TaxID=76305 RepID=A0ABY1PLK0_9HYPH|nr:hypothetical protein SAMN06265374_4339 [Roseibium denhamense]
MCRQKPNRLRKDGGARYYKVLEGRAGRPVKPETARPFLFRSAFDLVTDPLAAPSSLRPSAARAGTGEPNGYRGQ